MAGTGAGPGELGGGYRPFAGRPRASFPLRSKRSAQGGRAVFHRARRPGNRKALFAVGGGQAVRLKVLLMGPYPPPSGGVSVHVLAAHKLLTEAGLSCQVLNLPEPSRAKGAARLRHWARLVRSLRRRAKQGWIIHVHINGHNWKSWAVAAIGGVSGSAAAGRILTLHSGMVAKYLGTASAWRRALAAFACARFTRIVCVTTEIRAALLSLGVPIERTEILPAYLGAVPRKQGIEDWLLSWIREHSPVISTALFFRPEYGFRLLVEAVSRLRSRYPRLGCLVMGSGEEQTEAEQSIEKQG